MSSPSPEHRAFVEGGIGILMSIIMADGKYTQDEFVWWKAVQERHPLFRDVPPDVFNPLLRSVKEQLASQPWAALVTKWAKTVPEQFRRPVLELACELAVVDKDLAGKEPEVVRHLWQSLAISDDEGRKIFMAKIEGSMTS